MQNIEFSPEEAEVLREILQHGVSEIDVEVFHTDTHKFKEMLKHRRQVLENILIKLSAVPVPT
jgi:NifB/MoaA-like Fe-S oxidoreductase